MKNFIGLRLRLLICIGLAIAFATAIMGCLAIGMAYMAEDRILNTRLTAAEAHYRESLKSDDIEGTGDEFIQAGNDLSLFPDYLQDSLEKLEPGIHEWIGDDGLGVDDGHERLILVLDIEEAGRHWLVYDTTKLESNTSENKRLVWVVLTTAIATFIFCLLFSVLIGRWLFRPLRQLGERALSHDTEHAFSLAESFQDNEIGELAQAFDQAQNRLQAFLERERNFTRDASHELRTPVCVIEGALNILETEAELSAGGQRALARLKRACENIRMQIDAFLTLAREPDPHEVEDQSIREAIEAAITRNSTLAEERGISFRILSESDQSVSVPRAVTLIIFDNLLRNAIQHTDGEIIEIEIQKDFLKVSNEVQPHLVPAEPTRAHVSGGGSTGLGLSIVDGLCRRCSWNLQCRVYENSFEAQVGYGETAWGGGDELG